MHHTVFRYNFLLTDQNYAFTWKSLVKIKSVIFEKFTPMQIKLEILFQLKLHEYKIVKNYKFIFVARILFRKENYMHL